MNSTFLTHDRTLIVLSRCTCSTYSQFACKRRYDSTAEGRLRRGCFWGLRPEQWNCLKFNHHSVCSQPFNLLLGVTFERLYRFWRMIQFWHCQENTHLHEFLCHCSLRGYWAFACLVKFLDTVAMCSQGRINVPLMLCKWNNFDPNYLQNLSPDFVKILQITAMGYRLHISENISKGNPTLLQQERIEVWNCMPGPLGYSIRVSKFETIFNKL